MLFVDAIFIVRRSPKVRAAGRLRTWEETKEKWLLDEDSESNSISSSSSISSSVFGSDDAIASNSSATSVPENSLSSTSSSYDELRVDSNINTARGKAGLRKGRHGFKTDGSDGSDGSDGTADSSASSMSTGSLRRQRGKVPPLSLSFSSSHGWDGESAPLPRRTPAEIAAAMEGSASVIKTVPQASDCDGIAVHLLTSTFLNNSFICAFYKKHSLPFY